jgi:hypothetical protein
MPRMVGGGLGLWIALLFGAGCDGAGPTSTGGSPPATSSATTQALVTAAPAVTSGPGGPPGVRVSLAGTAHHVRGLERQPDGTYKSVCVDSPESLRPATDRSGARR